LSAIPVGIEVELGEQKALIVQQNAENFRRAVETGTPLATILEQLDDNKS
jgi:hypothetical protein